MVGEGAEEEVAEVLMAGRQERASAEVLAQKKETRTALGLSTPKLGTGTP